ncbi:MAG: aminotransferase class IV [Bacteroidota bacterium]
MYYNDNTILFLDGLFVKAKDAKMDLFGQTLHFGYGVFEGIRSYRTVNGTKIFKATEHYERLRQSAKLMGIPFHYSVNELVQITYHVLEKSKLSEAYIRPLVFCSPNMDTHFSERSVADDHCMGMGSLPGRQQPPRLHLVIPAS